MKLNILFDLDGTIGNTLPLCIAAFREAIEPLAERALADEEIIATFGPSEEGTIKALIPEHFEEGVVRYLDSYRRRHSGYCAAFEGIPEILRYARKQGCYVGMVTGKGPKSTQMTLESYGLLDCFDCVKTGSVVGPVKIERIEEVIKETGLPRKDFIYVGDTPSDIVAARACGIKVVAAAWAPTADFSLLANSQPDYIFASVSEFSKMLVARLDCRDEHGSDGDA